MIPVSEMPPDPLAALTLRFTIDDKPVRRFFVGQRVECMIDTGATLEFEVTAVDEETGDATLAWVDLADERHG